jgi:hypothetical protein
VDPLDVGMLLVCESRDDNDHLAVWSASGIRLGGEGAMTKLVDRPASDAPELCNGLPVVGLKVPDCLEVYLEHRQQLGE